MKVSKLKLAQHSPSRRALAWVVTALVGVLALASSTAHAAPEAHILRIDPRTGQENGAPVLTTVIELVQTKRISDATVNCTDDRGSSYYRCLSDSLEKPLALYQPFGAAGANFPHENALFTVKVEGSDQPAKYVSHTKWGASLAQPGVGTAWLIMVDADARIKDGFGDAKQVASAFIGSMSGSDIVNVMFFNDRQVVRDSKWMSAAKKGQAQQFVNSVTGTWASQGRNRSLGTIIKEAATDGFKSLGNVGEGVNVPLHQAMVVISTGYGGADALTTGPGGMQIAKYMTGGRFPEENTALPKHPYDLLGVDPDRRQGPGRLLFRGFRQGTVIAGGPLRIAGPRIDEDRRLPVRHEPSQTGDVDLYPLVVPEGEERLVKACDRSQREGVNPETLFLHHFLFFSLICRRPFGLGREAAFAPHSAILPFRLPGLAAELAPVGHALGDDLLVTPFRGPVERVPLALERLGAAGLKTPAEMDGMSLLDLLQGRQEKWRDAIFYEYYWERNFPQTPTVHAIRTDRYKYMHYHGIWDTDELYDLQNDPAEMKNLIDDPDHKPIVAQLNRRLFNWLEKSEGMLIPLRRDSGNQMNKRRPATK